LHFDIKAKISHIPPLTRRFHVVKVRFFCEPNYSAMFA
jgi:hypothetical protein